MKRTAASLSSVVLLCLTGCGKPPQTGGHPSGDFPVNVVGAPATVTNLLETIPLVGTFEAMERLQVVSELQGEVIELPVEEGTAVKAGQVLARLDPVKIDARLAEARSRLNLAETNYSRTQSLLKSETISEQEGDEAEAQFAQAKANLALLEAERADTLLKATFPGQVGERKVSVGQVVQPGQVMLDLVQMDPLEIRFAVPERYVSAVRQGLDVLIKSDAFPGDAFTGTVTYIGPEANRVTRTLDVKARVPNADGRLRPGMYGRVSVVLSRHANTLVVPEAAVMQNGPNTLVMAQNAEGRAEMRPVTVGLREGGLMEITSGLTSNDVVVVEGLMKTRPGALLAFSPESERYGLKPAAPPSAETQPEPQPES